MKILIDGRCLSDKSTGIKRYTQILIESYIQRYGFNSVFVLVDLSYDESEKFQKIIYNRKTYSFWSFFIFHKFLKKIDADIYHFPNHYNSFFKLSKKVYITTIHDIMYKVVPNFYRTCTLTNKLGIIKTDFFIDRSLKNSDLIFSISECTRKDIYNSFRYDSFVVSNGLNKINQIAEITQIKNINILEYDYFLYVGLRMNHKNVDFLIRCFLKSNTTKKLVICGKNHEHITSVNDRIIFLNFVDDITLASLYKYCAAFVYPSLYEGFGMPILEALSFGANVISSNGGALKEFSSEFIHFFDPKKESELIQLLENFEDKLQDKGKLQEYLNLFSWNNKMNELHNIINKLIPK